VSSRLEAIPDFKELQHVRSLREIYERKQPPIFSPIEPSSKDGLAADPLAKKKRQDEMVYASEAFMIRHNNASAVMKAIAIDVIKQGIPILGKYPGTSLGATLSQRRDWKLEDKKLGLWKMTDEGFSAAKARHGILADSAVNGIQARHVGNAA
jgi:hypothetical protein